MSSILSYPLSHTLLISSLSSHELSFLFLAHLLQSYPMPLFDMLHLSTLSTFLPSLPLALLRLISILISILYSLSLSLLISISPPMRFLPLHAKITWLSSPFYSLHLSILIYPYFFSLAPHSSICYPMPYPSCSLHSNPPTTPLLPHSSSLPAVTQWNLRHHSRQRRPGVPGWSQHERPGWSV